MKLSKSDNDFVPLVCCQVYLVKESLSLHFYIYKSHSIIEGGQFLLNQRNEENSKLILLLVL